MKAIRLAIMLDFISFLRENGFIASITLFLLGFVERCILLYLS